MVWALVIAIVIAVAALILIFIKNPIARKVVIFATAVMAEVKLKLDDDGQITKEEWGQILQKVLDLLGLAKPPI
jgi:hypothetical protein